MTASLHQHNIGTISMVRACPQICRCKVFSESPVAQHQNYDRLTSLRLSYSQTGKVKSAPQPPE
jgi:hypothetical protein